MLEELHLLRPLWLLGLAPIMALPFLWRRIPNNSAWMKHISPNLQATLLEEQVRPKIRQPLLLSIVILSLGVLGLSGPSWEKIPQPTNKKIDATIILLDLSLSMLTEDIAPSRLARAKQKISDILKIRTEGLTGLVAYAGDAHTVTPLTEDTNTIENLLPSLNPEMMPVPGSNPASAIEKSLQLFKNAGMETGLILIVSDGVEKASDLTQFKNQKFPISILSLGSKQGGSIPLDSKYSSDILKDQNGNVVITKVAPKELDAITKITFGRHRSASLLNTDIIELLDTPSFLGIETEETNLKADVWHDLGFWLCLGMLPLVLYSFPRAIFSGLLLLVIPATPMAAEWSDLWKRPDQRGYQSLQEGNYEKAASQFKNPKWRASALYLNKDFSEAELSFSLDQSATGHYNHGNSLAQQGKYELAINSYQRALAIDKSHADALHNKNLIQNLLKKNRENSEGKNEKKSEDISATRNAAKDNAQDDKPKKGKDSRKENEISTRSNQLSDHDEESISSHDEQKEAFEQWMRRIPDDPGGLLKRKFQHETNQRLRDGDYSHLNFENIW
ncbi:MAG: hypothetical protein CMD74_01980 [Gammaproteobacteria bacterium]|nr:hypothetical protein [Gammaproteobacteria bacterium]